jgi:2-C-methyl-D-erythritol 2,4-cyclodiphosphate synthase
MAPASHAGRMLSVVWRRASSETIRPDCAWSRQRAPRILADMVHVGIGYDVHQLVVGRKLVLGGVEIPHDKGLDGHSDADVLMHAVCDAVLGALGAGDIGQFFPNTDPRWKGAPSQVFLEEAARQVKFRNGRIVNVDASLIAQAPKVMPHAARMKQHIAEALGVPVAKVGIKATTNELLGFIGRGEGIAAMAVASVDLPD